MRRALVLTNEAARHPFRASLPPSALKVDEVEPRRFNRLALSEDVRGFMLAYCACFLAVLTFIA
jgi:hypothetical protein